MTDNEDDWNIPSDPEFERMRNRTKVMLRGIPIGLNKQGLRNMCEIYGEIKDIRWPIGKTYAFIDFKFAPEANNMLRRFADDHPHYPASAEMAHDRIEMPKSNSSDDNDFLGTVEKSLADDTPLKNVIELDNRKIVGLQSEPADFQWPSVMEGKNYRHIYLRMVDPKKEFLWNTNEEATTIFETDNRKVVNGRSVLKSCIPNMNNDPPTQLSSNQMSTVFNPDMLPPSLLCANCPRLAIMVCTVCDEPQCSIECHRSKHSNDKTAQITPPKNIRHTETIKDIVKITAVINHRLLFVRPAEKEREVAFARLMCDTVRCAKESVALTSLPDIGQYVLAKFDYYQRAMVLKHVSKSKVVVAFIDYGNIATYDYHDLKAMPEHLQEKKRFAVKIFLTKIVNDFMNEKALQYLYSLMVYNIELTINFDSTVENILAAELKASDKWVNSLVNSLNQEQIALPKPGHRAFHEDFDSIYDTIENLDNVCGKDVIIVDNSQIEMMELSFIMAKDLKKFLQNDRRIQNICNFLFSSQSSYCPKQLECCVVKYEGRWYRAYCLEIVYDGYATMHFIDYGNHHFIDIEYIRPIPDALLTEIITISANCFPDQKDLTAEDLKALRNKYPAKSQFLLDKTENRTIKIQMEEQPQIYAWLKHLKS